MPTTLDVAGARSLLFVPGDRPDRFAGAVAAGADGVVLDLEDAVGPDHKDRARDAVSRWLAGGGVGVVRVNAAGTAWHEEDLATVAGSTAVVMVPKATPATVAGVRERLPRGTRLVALVETAAGVLDARDTAADPGVVRLAFGTVDLGAELGVDPDDRDALLWARSLLTLASTAEGIAPPVDGVCTSLDDERLLTAQVVHAASMGFTGKLCVHPRQVAPTHAAFAPSAEAVALAQRIVEAAAGDGSVTTVDGKMLDKPVVDRARRVLQRARTTRPD